MTRTTATEASSSSFSHSIDDAAAPPPPPSPKAEPTRQPPSGQSQVSAFKKQNDSSGSENWVHQEVSGFETVWKEEIGNGWVVTDGNIDNVLDSMKGLSSPAFGAAMHGVEGQLEKLFDEMTPAQRSEFMTLAEKKGHLIREPNTDARDAGSCAPKAPALLRNDSHLPEPTRTMVRDANILSARAYREAFDAYAATPNAKPGDRAVELREPGTHDVLRGSLEHSWAEGITATASEYLADKQEGMDLGARVQNMRPGEEVKFEIEAGGSFGKSVKVKGSIEVKCEQVDGKPELAVGVDATCLAGLNLSGLKVLGGVDGKASFRFENADEAALAADLMKGMMNGDPSSAIAAMDPNVRAFFEKHLSAIELGPKGQAAAGAHLNAPFLKRAIGAEGKAELAESARIEFHQGKPELVMSLSGKLEAEVALSDRPSKLAGRIFAGSDGAELAKQFKSPDAKAELKMKFERHFPLEGASRLGRELPSTLTLTGEASAGRLNNRTGIERELKFTRKASDVDAAVKALLLNDFATAGSKLMGGYEDKTTTFRIRGEELGGDYELRGVGVVARQSVETRSVQKQTVREHSLH